MEKEWNFDNTYATLPSFFFSEQDPLPVKDCKLVIFNKKLAHELSTPLTPDVFVGNEIPKGATPLAQAYAGHQFGHFTMLGDGRAVLLGEHLTSSGKRLDIQLKGSGRTSYSRGGDGRAALGPMLREYIISEAMYHLGIPTTRSLAVALTGETVNRERKLKGAVLTRVAHSHIRVGTFEYAARFGTKKDVKTLADYTIKRHFEHLEKMPYPYLKLLQEVVSRQAKLIAKWQLIGFIHGVMNTDNMAISGETIDYGPCAFMDTYNIDTVFSSIDLQGRYAYGNQPEIGMWNLARFAETLLPLLHVDLKTALDMVQGSIKSFWDIYYRHWLYGMGKKIGLNAIKTGDENLIKNLLWLMQKYKSDYTNTFRFLTLDQLDEMPLFKTNEFRHWNDKWLMRLSSDKVHKEDITRLMKTANPAMIPRNHLVEEALAAAETADYSVMEKLLFALEAPYDYTVAQEAFTKCVAEHPCDYETFCGT